MFSLRARLLLPLLILCPLQPVLADEDCKGPSSECVPVGHWNFSVALGAGVRTNPLVHSQDIPLVVVPEISYYGKRFFLDNLDLGFTLAESATNSLSLIATPGYDRVFFYRSDLQNFFISRFTGGAGASASTGRPPLQPGVNLTSKPPDYTFVAEGSVTTAPPRKRKVIYLAGPEWTFKSHGVSGQLDVLREVIGRTDGTEVRAAVGVPLLQARGVLSANLGLTWKSAAIVNYYYGYPGIYQGGADLSPFVKLGYTRPLGGKWRLTMFAHLERQGNAIWHSPIVAHRYVTTAFVGSTYVF